MSKYIDSHLKHEMYTLLFRYILHTVLFYMFIHICRLLYQDSKFSGHVLVFTSFVWILSLIWVLLIEYGKWFANLRALNIQDNKEDAIPINFDGKKHIFIFPCSELKLNSEMDMSKRVDEGIVAYDMNPWGFALNIHCCAFSLFIMGCCITGVSPLMLHTTLLTLCIMSIALKKEDSAFIGGSCFPAENIAILILIITVVNLGVFAYIQGNEFITIGNVWIVLVIPIFSSIGFTKSLNEVCSILSLDLKFMMPSVVFMSFVILSFYFSFSGIELNCDERFLCVTSNGESLFPNKWQYMLLLFIFCPILFGVCINVVYSATCNNKPFLLRSLICCILTSSVCTYLPIGINFYLSVFSLSACMLLNGYVEYMSDRMARN